MALRRPPTRIELKADDIEDYDEILKERQLAAQSTQSSLHISLDKKGDGGMSKTPSPKVDRKRSAAERIGLRRGM